jgi:HAD superfamily hydrolase (TIGR01490 family)
MRDSVLRLTTGWDREHVRTIARDAIEEVIEPIVYEEALELIAAHQAAGEPVYLVSASPEEIVAPLAEHLGVDGFLATVAEVDAAGRYTGRTDRYCYGAEKVVAMRELADAAGLDLSASASYSDSATDEPMLAAVGRAVAVNPDRELLRIARERGWEVRWFVRPVRLRDRIPRPKPASAAVGGGLVAAVAGGVTYLWLRRERSAASPPPPAWNPQGWPRAVPQAWRTFLAAMVPRAMSTIRKRSFFIGRAG